MAPGDGQARVPRRGPSNLASSASLPLLVRRATIHEIHTEPRECRQCECWRRKCAQLQENLLELQRQLRCLKPPTPPVAAVVQCDGATQTASVSQASVASGTELEPLCAQAAVQTNHLDFQLQAETQTQVPNQKSAEVQVQPITSDDSCQAGATSVAHRRDVGFSVTLDDELHQKQRLELLAKIDSLIAQTERQRETLLREQIERRHVEDDAATLQCHWQRLKDVQSSPAWSALKSEHQLPLKYVGDFMGRVMSFCSRGDFPSLILPSLEMHLISCASASRRSSEATAVSAAALCRGALRRRGSMPSLGASTAL